MRWFTIRLSQEAMPPLHYVANQMTEETKLLVDRDTHFDLAQASSYRY